ncbi:F-box protein DOR-like [Brassica rapa]|uniref:F-box protein DOR-like n=1 Tax=Brassica campestris TaxID=3711 RepID=UPI00142E91A5|nr:F-box protein DOR-like [Brassica rapa]
MKTRKWTWLTGFLGYDPVEKQHKVLAMTSRNDRSKEHQVLTLGTGNLTWRMVKCGKPHPFPEVYASMGSEKYSFVKPPPERNLKMEKLINFQGKLASVRSRIFDSEESLSLEILILKDPKKHEWAIRIFNLPPMWKDGAAGKYLDVVGVTATNELVLSPRFPSYLYYYNFVSEDISRVDIRGIGAFEKEPRAHVILNHVEDAKIMELF